MINNAFGIGGTIRTTFNLATALAERHEVEVLSTLRGREIPQLPLGSSVRVMALVDTRQGSPDFAGDDPRRGRPARYYPRQDAGSKENDRLAEDRAAAYLRASDADVVIGTRAGIIAYIARFAPERMIRIGQEHLTRGQHPPSVRRAMVPHYRRLDAFVTVSEHDMLDYRAKLRLDRTRLLFIPNGVPASQVAPSDGRHKIVVAAGRVVRSKRHDLLVRAFAKVAAAYPDWQLRVYGGGEQLAPLRELVTELGLHNRVLLMGPYSPIDPEWAKGAIAAVTSDKEPFGMTLVEAMRCGLPVVSTDAPHGPAEILQPGVDGLLSPVGDADAFADALLELIGDEPRRLEMGRAALANSERYDPAVVAARYEELFAELAADKARGVTGVRPRLERLRSAVAGALSGGRSEPVVALGPAPHGALPIGECRVENDGELVFRLPVCALPAGDVQLLCQRRDGTEAHRHAVPAPVPGESHVSVRLARGGDGLTEGHWELFVAAGEHRERILAGLRDTRALLDAQPEDVDGVHVRLPYRTRDGFLNVRVWHRYPHVEVGDVQLDGLTTSFEARLIGARFGAATPTLRLRRRPDARVEHAPVERLDAQRFRAVVPAAQLTADRATDHDLWDIWLRYDDTAEPVRLGRFLDDVHNRQAATEFLPNAVLRDTPRGDVRVQLYYTAENEFSVRVVDLPPADD